MAHDSRNPHVFVDGPGNVASGDQVMDNFDSVWAGLDTAIAGVAASLDAPVITTAVSGTKVRDVGEANQIRAGRVLTVADFTNLGLAAPLGLWNLSNVNDSSGAARNLTNKGTVTFGSGIAGAATEAAIFTGSTAQALYISDTGGSDPFRIKTGSWGCWLRTAKRGTLQAPMAKYGTASQFAWSLYVNTNNVVQVTLSATGADNFSTTGTTDVADDRWHWVVVTHDGTRVRVYVDGALDGTSGFGGPIFGGSSPLNIGGQQADGATAAVNPFYGRVDEAFLTADVLSPEQVLNLYCARITHPLGSVPAHTIVRVGRQRRGGVLAVGDFPTQPTRLHNFTAGSLADSGSGGVTLVTNVGTGVQTPVGAVDGVRDGAYSFSGAHLGLSATDTGLPSGTAARSLGCWFKTTNAANQTMMAWGTVGTADARIQNGTGSMTSSSGADTITGVFVMDGLWHFVTVVEDNAAADGVKRKLYLDGRCIGGSTVLTSLTLAGANRFRVGANADGTVPFVGQIDAPFVYAGALTDVQVRALYNVGSLTLARSPKAEGDHVEALEASSVLAHFDALEGCDLVDLSVVG